MIYKGEYRRTLDADNRIELPGAMREVSDSNQYVITRGVETCVFLYPIKRWREKEEELGQLNDATPEVRHFYRTVMMWAFDAATDENGQIEIPTGLREFAGLEQEVLVLGAFTHVELWDPGRFDAYLNENVDYATQIKLLNG